MDFIYIVTEPHTKEGVYELTKYTDDLDFQDTFTIYVGRGELFCTCLGFRRQTYPAEQHKHIRLIRDYLERGSPECAQYRIKGKEHRLIYMGQNELLRDAHKPINIETDEEQQ